MVIFAPQNLIMDPPFTKLDFLSCRNLLIYLAPEMQKKLIPLFHYSLSPGGILFLGSAETVGTFTDLFMPLNNKLRIFRRIESVVAASHRISLVLQLRPSPAGARGSARRPRPQLNLQSLADQLVAAALRAAGGARQRPRATSFTSAAGPANTWSRPRARPTGIFLRWRARACATSCPAPCKKRFGRKGRVVLARLRIAAERRRAISSM